jgi:hypothetical protein
VAEIAFGAHAGRIKRDGVVEALDGLVDFLLTRQHHAQIVVGVSVIRVGIDRKAILRIGFVEVILRCQSEAGDLVSPREAQPFTAPKTRELPDEAFSQCFALLHRCIAASLHRCIVQSVNRTLNEDFAPSPTGLSVGSIATNALA